MIKLKDMTPSDWMKAAGIVVAMVTAYNSIGFMSDKIESHDKQLYFLQQDSKEQHTQIAVLQTNEKRADEDRAIFIETTNETRRAIDALNVSVAELRATLEQTNHETTKRFVASRSH
ncbi:hypothetical protein ACJ7VZ_05270 [Aeromonas salmonicida]|uniref:hypothetical protein n=1 Tax=Aeromonas salmonicida TaxID=645 RepID=UPI0038BA4820